MRLPNASHAVATLLVALLGIGGGWSCEVSKPENANETIMDTFAAYKAASIADDGAAATALLSRDTLAYFDELLDETLTADQARLDQLDPGRRCLVLAARILATPEELQRMSSAELAALAFRYKLLGEDIAEEHELEIAALDERRAMGRLRTGDQVLEYQQQHFVRDPDGWRVSLLPFLAEWHNALVERAKEMGIEPNLVADMALEALLFKMIEDKHMQPIIQKGPIGSVEPRSEP